MQVVCMLYGGVERIIIDGRRKKWRFEDHQYCGPIGLTGTTGEIAENQPPAGELAVLRCRESLVRAGQAHQRPEDRRNLVRMG